MPEPEFEIHIRKQPFNEKTVCFQTNDQLIVLHIINVMFTMYPKFLFNFFALILLTVNFSVANNVPPAQQICGKWESSDKNLIVQVYEVDNKFVGKIIWYSDTGGKPMDYGTDWRNPDPKLRTRKILGMPVLSGMVYEPESNSWENGTIYESKNGREWNASIYIDKQGFLKVKGYWHIKIIGRTMTFFRV